MKQEFLELANDVDQDGNPAGGIAHAVGLIIRWQDGPLGVGADKKDPNGTFVETVLEAAAQRLRFYQASKFACQTNQDALESIEAAMESLQSRTRDRLERGVEGTHTR